MKTEVALVTGTSSGIGLEIVSELCRNGSSVWAGVRSAESKETVREHVLRRTGHSAIERLHFVEMDVREPKQIDCAVRKMLQEAPHAPDLVVANAGIGASGFVENITPAEWQETLDTNLIGAVSLVRSTLPAMRERGRGRYFLVSSNAANAPHPAFSAYAASKWALEGVAEALSIEVEPFGIDVTIVQPGSVRSGFTDRIIGGSNMSEAYGPIMSALLPAWEWLGSRAIGADTVARRIVREAGRDNAKLRLRIGLDAHVAAWTRHIVPGGLRLALYRRFYRMPRRGSATEPGVAMPREDAT